MLNRSPFFISLYSDILTRYQTNWFRGSIREKVGASKKDPLLLTPGPLTTTLLTKEAMLHDWGSRDTKFLEINLSLQKRLINIVDGKDTHVCVPLQGSGTLFIEATIATLIPPDGEALVLINGAYGHRMVKILNYLNRNFEILETPEDVPPSIDDLNHKLSENSQISHVLAVHCETTTGILNPIEQISETVTKYKRSLIIDAMSSFGAIPISAKSINFDAVVASSNKCLEGVPGIGFAIMKKSSLEECKNNAHSLSLDLYDQWISMEKDQQWRFTPPTHVIFALNTALDQFEREGGVKGRNLRYSNNCNTLISGMKQMGFVPLLSQDLQSPIIVTFKMPKTVKFDFSVFYNTLKDKGFIIYPGKLTNQPSFRIGCIGDLTKTDMVTVITAINETLNFMDV